jgi:predicted acetyltransferase
MNENKSLLKTLVKEGLNTAIKNGEVNMTDAEVEIKKLQQLLDRRADQTECLLDRAVNRLSRFVKEANLDGVNCPIGVSILESGTIFLKYRLSTSIVRCKDAAEAAYYINTYLDNFIPSRGNRT